jgi:DMSO/TMAO reductase YedYZ molybdopterin-dependent catalytic subunit
MEPPPGELPAFLAYRLNGEPLPLERGGPVRMIVPWAYGFKSIKWLQRIVVTNDYQANDTYALQNNDPESHLKTAAYLDELPAELPSGQPVRLGGLVISGLSGLDRVEYRLTREGAPPVCTNVGSRAGSKSRQRWSTVLPRRLTPSGARFDPQPPGLRPGRSVTAWCPGPRTSGFTAGKYAASVRAVDLNGFAQPEPRPCRPRAATPGNAGVRVV